MFFWTHVYVHVYICVYVYVYTWIVGVWVFFCVWYVSMFVHVFIYEWVSLYVSECVLFVCRCFCFLVCVFVNMSVQYEKEKGKRRNVVVTLARLFMFAPLSAHLFTQQSDSPSSSIMDILNISLYVFKVAPHICLSTCLLVFHSMSMTPTSQNIVCIKHKFHLHVTLSLPWDRVIWGTYKLKKSSRHFSKGHLFAKHSRIVSSTCMKFLPRYFMCLAFLSYKS